MTKPQRPTNPRERTADAFVIGTRTSVLCWSSLHPRHARRRLVRWRYVDRLVAGVHAAPEVPAAGVGRDRPAAQLGLKPGREAEVPDAPRRPGILGHAIFHFVTLEPATQRLIVGLH